MQDTFKRLHILMGDTLQILDHMKVDPEYDQMYRQIVNGLQEQNEKIALFANHMAEEQSAAAFSISENLNKINNLVQQLESRLMEDYQKSTEHQMEQYEQMDLEEQMEQTENYHNKIDYLSAVKIRENISRMNEALQVLSGKRA